ncbi:hypothetical protein BaRGS_00001308, partial [Batillaria attramentaria]
MAVIDEEGKTILPEPAATTDGVDKHNEARLGTDQEYGVGPRQAWAESVEPSKAGRMDCDRDTGKRLCDFVLYETADHNDVGTTGPGGEDQCDSNSCREGALWSGPVAMNFHCTRREPCDECGFGGFSRLATSLASIIHTAGRTSKCKCVKLTPFPSRSSVVIDTSTRFDQEGTQVYVDYSTGGQVLKMAPTQFLYLHIKLPDDVLVESSLAKINELTGWLALPHVLRALRGWVICGWNVRRYASDMTQERPYDGAQKKKMMSVDLKLRDVKVLVRAYVFD